MIDKLLIDSPNVGKCYEIVMREHSNGGKMAAQLEDIFKEKGFSWGGGGAEYGGVLKGIVISINREHFNCIKLSIGTID